MKGKGVMSRSFVIGAVALLFLAVGYQTALFLHSAAVEKVAANRDVPDTVYVYTDGLQEGCPEERTERKYAEHSETVRQMREKLPVRKVESFSFNPNTVSVEDLCRLGFSLKQAQSIDNYRKKGGKFRRKEDFAKSYVVSDSIYRRLEAYISIPKIDLNRADSLQLVSLPGIGGWFANKILAHRQALGGFSYKEQLMDIYRFDEEKYHGLEDLVTVSTKHISPYPLWSLPADSLAKHPYISYAEAESIVFFRQNNPKEKCTMDNIIKAGILSEEHACKLSRCAIAAR